MRTNKPLLLWLLLANAGAALAQTYAPTHSARESALGGCMLFLPKECFAEVNAAIPYGLPQMADKGLSLQWATPKHGTLHAHYNHRGDNALHEQQVAARYSLPITKDLHIGVGATYHHTATDDPHYEPQQSLSPTLLLHLRHGHTAWTATAEHRPQSPDHPIELRLQLQHHPTATVLALIEADYGDRLRWRMAVEWCYESHFYLRAGASTSPLALTAGAGVRWRNYAFDFAAQSHRALGLTPTTSIKIWL